MINHFTYFGLIASIWMLCGVFIAAKLYPNYSHRKQFCSELGAKGSPTEKISPIINNYPLGLLFVCFGLAVIQTGSNYWLLIITGWLIIIHGIGTWLVGYFPMDADAYTQSPTLHCKIHYWSGTVMLLSLLCAQIITLFIPSNEFITESFKIFSLFSLISTAYFTKKLAKSYKNKTIPGFYQRLSYGSQLIWLSGLSIMLTK